MDKFKDLEKSGDFIFNNNTIVVLKDDKLQLFENDKCIEIIDFININSLYIIIKNLICLLNSEVILLICNNKIIKFVKEGNINKYITNNNLLLLLDNNKINVAINLNKKTLFNKYLINKCINDISDNILILHKEDNVYQYYNTNNNTFIGEGHFIKIHKGNIIEYNGKINIIKNNSDKEIEGIINSDVINSDIEDIDDISSDWSMSMRRCIKCKSSISEIYIIIPCGHAKMCKLCIDLFDNCIVCNIKKEGTNIIKI